MESSVAAGTAPAPPLPLAAARAPNGLVLILLPPWRPTAGCLGADTRLSGSFASLLMSRFAQGPEATHVPPSNSPKDTVPQGGVGRPTWPLPWTSLSVRGLRPRSGAASVPSWATGRGSGSVVGGHVILAIDPLALERLSSGRQVSLVSGTNGKTTTTKLLACALSSRGQGKVVTNLLGANLPTGLVASMAGGPPRVPAVLEVDEAWLARVAARTQPSLLLLLNLSRDQLDRNNEVRQVAQRWRQACEDSSADATVVANADDPLVAWAAAGARQVTWVGAGLRWKGDATGCPACGGAVVFGPDRS